MAFATAAAASATRQQEALQQQLLQGATASASSGIAIQAALLCFLLKQLKQQQGRPNYGRHAQYNADAAEVDSTPTNS